MTEAAKTISLDSNEWRTLLNHNLTQAAQFVQQNERITPETLAAFSAHVERGKILAASWLRSQPAAGQEAAQPAEGVAGPEKNAHAGEAANGAERPKRKGGWPKGQPRKQRNAPRPQVQ